MSLGVSSCHPFTTLAQWVYGALVLSDADWLARERARAVSQGFPARVDDPVALGVVAAVLTACQSRLCAPVSRPEPSQASEQHPAA